MGGDVWFVRDVDGDGVAESLDHFLSIQVSGSETTGMIFNPVNPTEFIVSVQHPDSTRQSQVPDGFGDALWVFDLTNVVPPSCAKAGDDPSKRTCSSAQDSQFVTMLRRAGRMAH